MISIIAELLKSVKPNTLSSSQFSSRSFKFDEVYAVGGDDCSVGKSVLSVDP